MKKDLVDTSIIFRYFSSSASEMLDFSAKIFFVVRYNIVDLNDNERKFELNVSINDKCFELVIVSA